MIVLGIEGTAHTFSVGVIDENEILFMEGDMYKAPPGEGIHPNMAAVHHKKVASELIKRAMEFKPDLLAYSAGPGLAPCLMETLNQIKKLAEETGLKVVPVNHPVAHIEIANRICETKDPIILYLSGGNSQVIGYESGKYRVFGETLDQAIGKTIDTFGRHVGLDFPGGPKVEKLAKNGKFIPLPYSVKGMDFSFTGMLTKLQSLSKDHSVEDLSYSLQETAFAMMVEVAERAMAHTNKNELLLTGGVVANERLKEMCQIMCEERDAKFQAVPFKYSGDNGAMIAIVGLLDKNNAKDWKELNFDPKWRVDQVEVGWR